MCICLEKRKSGGNRGEGEVGKDKGEDRKIEFGFGLVKSRFV